MHFSSRLYICVLMTTLLSCQQKTKLQQPTNATSTKQHNNTQLQTDIKKTHTPDSLLLTAALTQILENLAQQSNRAVFDSSYEQEIEHSFLSSVSIRMGALFSNNSKHLIIRQTAPWAVVISVYRVNNSQFNLLFTHEQSALSYTDDRISDINGDGLNDFIVNWYGESGCCLKAFSEVYLSNEKFDRFSERFTFINPTFSPKEKLIRGVCYGHPGETEMYKFKWNREQVDTIAYISFEKNSAGQKTGRFIESPRRDWEDSAPPRYRILSAVPDEYTHIEGYDWFLGNPSIQQ